MLSHDSDGSVPFLLLLLQFGTQHLKCAISGNYHGMLYLQTIPGTLVVANRTQIPTCLEHDHCTEVLLYLK